MRFVRCLPLYMVGVLGLCFDSGVASADPTPRYSTVVNGGSRFIGTTMGYDCGSNAPVPPGATTNCTVGVSNPADSSPDIYWRDNSASSLNVPGTSVNDPRTAVALSLPPGATVQYARLYWGGRRLGLLADGEITFAYVGGSSETVVSDEEWAIDSGGGTQAYYQSTADVTSLVALQGSGVYRLNGLDALPLPNLNEDVMYAAWSLFVVYEEAGAPAANVALYDGFDQVFGNTGTSTADLSFVVPNSPTVSGALTVMSYEGDFETIGESIQWNGTSLANALNPVNNPFNSSRTINGLAQANALDVPQLAGLPDHMASFDLDTFNVSNQITAGDTMATVLVTSPADRLFLGAVATEVRGCQVSTDCTDPAAPACNLDTGNCEVCTDDDPGICPTEDGPICIEEEGEESFCGCVVDADCGGPMSGVVCDTEGTDTCIPGCRGIGGNGCPDGETCTSMDESIGICTTPCTTDERCTEPGAPYCNVQLELCVECLEDDHCKSEECEERVGTCGPPMPEGGGNQGGGDQGGGNVGGGNVGGGGAMSAGGNGQGGAGGGALEGFNVEGGGCSCDVPGRTSGSGLILAAGLAALGLSRRRRR